MHAVESDFSERRHQGGAVLAFDSDDLRDSTEITANQTRLLDILMNVELRLASRPRDQTHEGYVAAARLNEHTGHGDPYIEPVITEIRRHKSRCLLGSPTAALYQRS